MASNEYVEAEGTVSVPSGSKTVIGTGTGFATKAVANGTLRIGGVSAAISTVDNDTRLTLLNNWPGPTVSDSVYEIDRVISDAGDTVLVHDKSAQMLALLNAIASGFGETLLSAADANAALSALQAGTFGKQLFGAATNTGALIDLGSSTTGRSLFSTASPAAARSTLGVRNWTQTIRTTSNAAISVPSGATHFEAVGCGGGGGGGGVDGQGPGTAGSSQGGGSGYSGTTGLLSVGSVTTCGVTIGAGGGGGGGTGGANGGDGGDTELSLGGTTYRFGGGGGGQGIIAASSFPFGDSRGAGGLGLNVYGFSQNASLAAQRASVSIGGSGGSSMFGRGGPSTRAVNGAEHGADGEGYGSGGGGAAAEDSTGDRNGGDGAPGVLFMNWFYLG